MTNNRDDDFFADLIGTNDIPAPKYKQNWQAARGHFGHDADFVYYSSSKEFGKSSPSDCVFMVPNTYVGDDAEVIEWQP